MPGPNLAGLIGRKVAGDPAFDYSPVLRQAREEGRVWTPRRSKHSSPTRKPCFPRTWMSAQGIRGRRRSAGAGAFHRRSGVAIGRTAAMMAVRGAIG